MQELLKTSQPKTIRVILALALLTSLLLGCASPTLSLAPSATGLSPTNTPTFTPVPTPTVTLIPSPTALPSPTASPTPVPFYLSATVYPGDPQVAVLLYHRFSPDSAPYSTAVKTRLGDFRAHLQRLFEAGYSLIPLADWLNGKMVLPAGRRPLILTMDDLFYADQIYLEEDGTPSTDSGIGVLWAFSQTHPDFGFSVALFATLGDKYYANARQNGHFVLGKNWEDSLAKVIVWCIEHNAMPYNHTYNHPRLDLTPGDKLLWELKKNDDTLLSYLDRAGRPDLATRLDNLLALPFSIWPASDAGKKLIEGYVSPRGKPLQAIFEADYHYRPKYMPAPYQTTFDRFHLPRMEGLNGAITLLETKKDLFPTVSACQVGPLDQTRQGDPGYLASQVTGMVGQGKCPQGVYVLGGYLFRAGANETQKIKISP